MSPPRIAAIISGVAASTAVFIVSSRWHLAGTLTGSALAPVIYILVAHGSSEGIENLKRRLERRRESRGPGSGADRPTTRTVYPASPGKPDHAARHARAQWWLVGFACLAVVLSVYALTAPHGMEKTIVRETIVQPTNADQPKAAAEGTGATEPAGSSPTEPEGGTATTRTKPTASTTTDTGENESTPSTATSAPAEGDTPSSTTEAALPATVTTGS